jgi:hypothetical protein
MVPGPGIETTDLRYQEFAAYTFRALWARGYRPAERPENADLSITLSFGVRTGNRHVEMTGTAAGGSSGPDALGAVNSSAQMQASSREWMEQGCYIELTAFDMASVIKHAPVEVWDTRMNTTTVTNDLRRVFPRLLASGVPFIGDDTHGQRVVAVYDSSEWVSYVMGTASGSQ